MNKVLRIVVILVVIFFGLTFVKNSVFGSILSGALSKAAHVPVHIGNTQVSLLSTAITLKNLKIHNPRSFQDKILLDAPLVSIDFDPPAFFKGQLHFQEVRLNLKEIVVVKNKNGQLNVDAMKPRKEETQKAREVKKPAKRAPKLLIDKLYLTVGRVVYKDYSLGGEPMIRSFDINMRDRLYTYIDNPTSLISLIMSEALTRTTLSRLANLDIGSFKEGSSGVLDGGLEMLGEGTGEIPSKVKDILSLFK
ncbi:MAG: hypothetical protein A3C47_05255 [Omnitrophica bacterium RIFCSPHIGHO2_02_FULL_51_18]|nr:MAG: hypothetical protein A3C47_05255 [Omnitrophica bacterium RIFCSPHIGHO2_02_FULL_51_18]